MKEPFLTSDETLRARSLAVEMFDLLCRAGFDSMDEARRWGDIHDYVLGLRPIDNPSGGEG